MIAVTNTDQKLQQKTAWTNLWILIIAHPHPEVGMPTGIMPELNYFNIKHKIELGNSLNCPLKFKFSRFAVNLKTAFNRTNLEFF